MEIEAMMGQTLSAIFSRDEATLCNYCKRVSVRWLVRPLVRRSVGWLRFRFSAY